MIEHELVELAERVAPPVRADLADAVLARLAEPAPRSRWRLAVASAVAALVAAFGLSPQVRAFAADLLGVAGIEVTWGEPDAAPTPDAPLPRTRETSLGDARAAAEFTVSVPAALGDPEHVTVSDGGRVVTMSWRDGEVVLDQFAGSLDPVFLKEVVGATIGAADVGGASAFWIGGPHDLTYVDRSGTPVTATARLAGRTLIWDGGAGVTYRLEGADLEFGEAVDVARSVR